jgi:L,D-transpeptidase YcbB
VGKVDHPSPQLTATIQSITINPTWTIPRSIVENEIIPKLKKDPGYLRRAKLIVLDQRGRKTNLRHFRHAATSLIFRQEPGSKNALGRLRIDMPNPHAVYMHDTPLQRLSPKITASLRMDVFVSMASELAIWLLNIVNSARHWERQAIDDKVQEGDRSPRETSIRATRNRLWVQGRAFMGYTLMGCG